MAVRRPRGPASPARAIQASTASGRPRRSVLGRGKAPVSTAMISPASESARKGSRPVSAS